MCDCRDGVLVVLLQGNSNNASIPTGEPLGRHRATSVAPVAVRLVLVSPGIQRPAIPGPLEDGSFAVDGDLDAFPSEVSVSEVCVNVGDAESPRFKDIPRDVPASDFVDDFHMC